MPAGAPPARRARGRARRAGAGQSLGDRGRAARACWLAMQALTAASGSQLAGTPEYRRWVEAAGRYARPRTLDRARVELAMASVQEEVGRLTEAWASYHHALAQGPAAR
jgi:hypothetical protein